jgi:type II secretory pathway pseudopilin PulG
LVELLVVIGIIAILAAVLMPAIESAREHAREGATRSEATGMQNSFTMYFNDWHVYPPDVNGSNIDGLNEPGECLVYYLGNRFEAGSGSTRNAGPYREFPADRMTNPDGDDYPCFQDMFGGRDGVDFYRFDNNDDDAGNTPPSPGSAADQDTGPNGWNVTNVNRTSIDVWSAGPDGTDEASGHDEKWSNPPDSAPYVPDSQPTNPRWDNRDSLTGEDFIGSW